MCGYDQCVDFLLSNGQQREDKLHRIHSFLISSLLILLCFSNVSAAQLWSGVISPARATDWTRAGVVGGIPSGSWTACATIAPFSGSATPINNAIASCGSNQYVQLGAGTFNLSSGISFGHKSNVVLRQGRW